MKLTFFTTLVLIGLVSTSYYAKAQERSKEHLRTDTVKTTSGTLPKVKFIIDIPVADLPFNFQNHGLSVKQFSPGMQQSLNWSKSVMETQQYYTKRLFINPDASYSKGSLLWRKIATGVSDAFIEGALISHLPLSTGWMHEEWHRAIMTKNNVRSHNELNDFSFGFGSASVSHETDEQLSKFKASDNKDFVRMASAGMESQSEYVKALQKDNFYYHLNLSNSASQLLNTLENIYYLKLSVSKEGDKQTMKAEDDEGTNIKKRDFMGLDPLAWMYDLSRPKEAYENRGIHPSGVGVRRYRLTTDLTGEEMKYLKKMGNLNLINLLSPQLFYIEAFQLNQDTRLNAGLFHTLTAFGYDLGANVFIQHKEDNWFFTLHNYHNFQNSFYGIEAQMIDKKVMFGNSKVLLTPSVNLWTQPKDQLFRTASSQFGGKAELKAATMISQTWSPYLAVSAKTSGWVAGDAYLNNNVSVRFGIKAYIH
jgi:hypothetical protein